MAGTPPMTTSAPLRRRLYALTSEFTRFLTGVDIESYAQNPTPGAWRVLWHYGPDPGVLTILMITEHP
jgi:hypothetical protein